MITTPTCKFLQIPIVFELGFHLFTFVLILRWIWKTLIEYYSVIVSFGKDCKVILIKYLGTQHRLLVLDVEFKYTKWKKRSVADTRVKLWNLTKKNARKLSERITEEGVWRQVEDTDTIWEAMAKCIRSSAKKILGTSRRCGNKMNGAWW